MPIAVFPRPGSAIKLLEDQFVVICRKLPTVLEFWSRRTRIISTPPLVEVEEQLQPADMGLGVAGEQAVIIEFQIEAVGRDDFETGFNYAEDIVEIGLDLDIQHTVE
jgi:hypothetical protein